MTLSVKRGDAKLLRLSLGRDLTDVDTARVIIAAKPGADPVLDRAGTIEDAAGGVVTLQLMPEDYDTLTVGSYFLEVETMPGPLTHPDSQPAYIYLTVLQDLG